MVSLEGPEPHAGREVVNQIGESRTAFRRAAYRKPRHALRSDTAPTLRRPNLPSVGILDRWLESFDDEDRKQNAYTAYALGFICVAASIFGFIFLQLERLHVSE